MFMFLLEYNTAQKHNYEVVRKEKQELKNKSRINLSKKVIK